MGLRLPGRFFATEAEIPSNLSIPEAGHGSRPETSEQEQKNPNEQKYESFILRENELHYESNAIFGVENLAKEGYQQLVDVFGAEAVIEAIAEVQYEGSIKLGDVIRSLEPDTKKREILYKDLQSRVTTSGFEDPNFENKPYHEMTDLEREFERTGPNLHNKRIATVHLETAQSWESPFLQNALKLIDRSTASDISLAMDNIYGVDLVKLRDDLLQNPNIYQVAAERRIAQTEKERTFKKQIAEFIQELQNKIDVANKNIELELAEKRLEKIQELTRAIDALGTKKEHEKQLTVIQKQIFQEIHQLEKIAEMRKVEEVAPLEQLKRNSDSLLLTQ